MRCKILAILLILFIAIYSCKKPEQYSEIPEISFKDIRIENTYDTLDNHIKRVYLTFYVIDGDGDIGLDTSEHYPPYDTSSVYYHNLFIDEFEKINGIYEPIDLTVPLYYRIPNIVQKGKNKTLKADIIIKLDYTLPSLYDTIKYDFFIYDRALHKSNTVSTSDIILNN
ncbi:MAG: hypothetical protein A2033_17475 [Bacteroidetes bacterium GWA2_31_9]|nr:MAG: hypothetical protein A2033_17475 [Bacteroidetes bacterium GWA2_31_9]